MALINTALTALDAARAGLQNAQNNIANVNTQGYHRREVAFGTNLSAYTGGGFLGAGVHVETVRGIYNQFLDSEVLATQSLAERYDNYAIHASTLDKLLGGQNSGLSGTIQNFFAAANEVANAPTSTAARQSLLSAGNSLVTRFNAVEDYLASVQDNINEEVTSTVDQINRLAGQIATVNNQITAFQASSQQPANDLLDTRSRLLEDLSKLVNITVLDQDGLSSVFIGNGQALVLGSNATTMSTIADSADPENLLPAIQSGGTTLPGMDTSVITGGSLGGLLAFREEILKPSQTAVDRLAYVMATEFNEIHNDGADLNGKVNQNFFSVTPTQQALNLGSTAASITVTIPPANANLLTDSDYILSYDGANYTLTRLSDGMSATGTLAAVTTFGSSSQGFTLAVGAGVPAAGESWLIRPMHDSARSIDMAISQPSQVAAATPSLDTIAASSNAGTATIGAAAFAGPPYNAALLDTVRIVFTAAGQYDVIDDTTGATLAAAQAYVSGNNITYNGWTVQITNGATAPVAPQVGDTFTVKYQATGDNSIALQYAAAQTNSANVQGGLTYSSAYNKLVNYVASLASDAKISAETNETMLSDVKAQRDSISGVNLDEEAAKLIQFQQAYQAAAKSIQTANSIFDELLNAVR
ncbi:MAG: flagellar hook-associated protein FlgK [Hydrogenophilaceae bacterium]|nr:flagellar hook-associated protein FlgK [Hydrogenophilaceae bacterium]